MTPPTRGWNVCATIYRALVVAQTLAWAVETLVRISMRHAAASRTAPPTGAALAMASMMASGAGVLTYYACRSRWPERAAVLLAWPWFQAAGVVALIGYAITGATLYFLIGIVTLAVMHAFSPNRFAPAPQRHRHDHHRSRS
jgi:hypothetical protein